MGAARTAALARTTALLAALALLPSCSLFMRGVPDDWTPEKKLDCQPFIIVPIVDGVIAGGALAWAAGTGCDTAGTCLGTLAAAGLFGTAAVLGYLKVKKCNRARQQVEDSLKSDEAWLPPQPSRPRPAPAAARYPYSSGS